MKKKNIIYVVIILLIFTLFGGIMINFVQNYYTYSLIKAINNDDISQVSDIINKHPDSVNNLPSSMPDWWNKLIDKQNLYPIQVASYKGNIEIVKLLLESGANVNLVDPYIGSTALLMALTSTSESRFDIAFLLIEHGADINAIRKNRPDQIVISESVIVRETDSDNSKKRANELFDYLFEKVNKDTNWIKVLMNSAYFGNLHSLNKLINSGVVNINSTNLLGQTPLIMAVLGNEKETVSNLLNNGADFSIRDKDNKSAYDYAVERNYSEIIEVLNRKM